MRIAFVTHQFFPMFVTGVERLTLNLARQLARMGHGTVVLTSADHSLGATQPYAFEGVAVRPVGARQADPARPWLDGTDPALRRVLDEERPDLLHVMHPMRLPQGYDEAERRGLPVVTHVADFFHLCARITMLHEDGTLCGGPGVDATCAAACEAASPERLDWARRVLGGAAAVVAPSRYLIELHRAQFDTSAWHHVPWGVDYARHPARVAPPGADGLTVGFLGTLLPHKGPHLLADAMRLLPERDVHLELYGPSYHEGAYERDLRRAAAGDRRIRLHGGYEHAELAGILGGLDVVAIPSLWHENLPTSGLNAVAAGVPLVVADVGGLVELVKDYDAGFTFRRGDAADLARVLAELADDPARLEAARSGLRHPPSLEEEAWRLEAIYAGALG